MTEGDLTILKGDENYASLPDVSLASLYMQQSFTYPLYRSPFFTSTLSGSESVNDYSSQPQSAS